MEIRRYCQVERGKHDDSKTTTLVRYSGVRYSGASRPQTASMRGALLSLVLVLGVVLTQHSKLSQPPLYLYPRSSPDSKHFYLYPPLHQTRVPLGLTSGLGLGGFGLLPGDRHQVYGDYHQYQHLFTPGTEGAKLTDWTPWSTLANWSGWSRSGFGFGSVRGIPRRRYGLGYVLY